MGSRSESGSESRWPKIAVIGSGYWGNNLVRNYHQLGALALICDKDEARLAEFKKRYPDIDTCLTLSDVLLRPDIEAVVIASPAETHYLLTREALTAGKHVFVEKPLTLDTAEAEELIALAETQNLILMVGHLLQYHPVFEKLKELARSGELGRINYIYSHRLNLGKIRREENILWSFAPHDISMILSLAGERPDSLFTTGGNYLHQQIADVTTTHLSFPSGLKAHIFVSWLHPYKEQKLVVVGDRKMAVFDDTKHWEDKLLLYPHQIKWENGIPTAAKAEAERVAVSQQEPLKQECEHFLNCVARLRRPTTDGREGLVVLKVLKASQRSLDSGGGRIELDWAERKGHPPGEDVFIHPTAILDPDAEVAAGTKVWHFSHIMSGSKVGRRCNIGQNVVIGPEAVIGDGCKIQNNVSVYKGVTLEDEVFCGPSMVFTNVYNPRAHIRRMDQIRPTLVKKGATLGANSTIICGVTIGRYAFVGAGAVVARDVPDHALVYGNTARIKGWMCQCGVRLHFEQAGNGDVEEAACDACGTRYRKEGEMVAPVA